MRRSDLFRTCALGLTLAATVLASMPTADAQRVRAGAAAGASRTASVSRGAHAGSYGGSYSASASASRTTVHRNAQVNQNVNVTRNVNVDVDHRAGYGYGGALAVAGAAAVTAAAIGTVAYSIPPSCTTVVSAGVTYQQCGNTWYQPQYAGTSVTYVVTNPPQ
jgi:hypothetical protein